MASYATAIVLGYGLCSNGLVGVTARRQKLIVPRCHDCIALFLGSPARYDAVFRDHPGTFYLTPGWVKENQDPLGIYQMGISAQVWGENGPLGDQGELEELYPYRADQLGYA